MATHSSAVARKFHGQGRLAGFSPWDHEESDTTAQLSTQAARKGQKREVLPLGPPSVPRKRRAGEGGRPLRPHAGPSGRGAQGLGGRSCLTNCAGSTDALPGVEPERDRLPDSWKVALSTHDRRDGGGPRCGRAGFRRVLFSSPWALTPRPLSFQPSRPLTSCSRPSCPSCPTPTAGSTGAAGSPT